jgi:hypothetical protein
MSAFGRSSRLPSVRFPTRKTRQKRERGNLKARLRSKHVKTLLREYVYDHRFLVNSALYFHDKWSLRQGFPRLRFRIVIQLQYGPTGERERFARCKARSRFAAVPGRKTAPENLIRGHRRYAGRPHSGL